MQLLLVEGVCDGGLVMGTDPSARLRTFLCRSWRIASSWRTLFALALLLVLILMVDAIVQVCVVVQFVLSVDLLDASRELDCGSRRQHILHHLLLVLAVDQLRSG